MAGKETKAAAWQGPTSIGGALDEIQKILSGFTKKDQVQILKAIGGLHNVVVKSTFVPVGSPVAPTGGKAKGAVSAALRSKKSPEELLAAKRVKDANTALAATGNAEVKDDDPLKVEQASALAALRSFRASKAGKRTSEGGAYKKVAPSSTKAPATGFFGSATGGGASPPTEAATGKGH